MPNKLFEALEKNGVDIQETLERFMNDEALYEKYLKRFPEEKTMKLLKEAVDANNPSAAQEAIHALKGIADNLGFTDFVDAAVDMLFEFRNQRPEEGMRLFAKVRQEYDVICQVIVQFSE